MDDKKFSQKSYTAKPEKTVQEMGYQAKPITQQIPTQTIEPSAIIPEKPKKMDL